MPITGALQDTVSKYTKKFKHACAHTKYSAVINSIVNRDNGNCIKE
jgi:hypothetical protein